MKFMIVYGSKYGSTKRYADKLGEMTGFEVTDYQALTDLTAYEGVIHLGSLLGGGVRGLGKTMKLIAPGSSLFIVTVGLADVKNQENTDRLKESLKQQISSDWYDRAKIFHLRGAMDYNKLGFLHRLMMKMVLRKVNKIDENKRTQEEQEMIETFGKSVDFVDFESLNPIVRSIEEEIALKDSSSVVE